MHPSHWLHRRLSWRARIGIPLAVLVAFFAVASLGYHLVDGRYGWGDAVYMTMITIASVGYREVHELSGPGRAWTIFVIIGGLVTGTVVLSQIAALVVEGQVRRVLGRRKLEKRIAGMQGHAIVCGFGMMGSMVARGLREGGQEVVVVETAPERTSQAESEGMLYVLGDAQDEAVLDAAGIAGAGYLVSALPTDADNVFVTLSARQRRADLHIIARAQQPNSERKLLAAGANRVVCPQRIGAMRMADVVLRPAVVDFFEIMHQGVELEMEQCPLPPHCALIGQTLAEAALPKVAGAQVVAIRKANGKAVYHPRSDYRMEAGDTLYLVGKRGVATAVQRLGPEIDERPTE